MTNTLSAILLDLDGTLVDSAPELAAAVNTALEPLGRPSLALDEVRLMIGSGLPTLTRRALAATGGVPEDAATEAVIAEVRRAYDLQPAPTIFPGVDEALRDWHRRGLALIVCTNKPEGSARRLMTELAWDTLLAGLAGGDSYPARKPHPDHLLLPLTDLGIPPASAVMVGDSAIDAEAARKAGIPFIAVSYGYTDEAVESLGAVTVVDDFKAVDGAIAQLAEARGLSFSGAS